MKFSEEVSLAALTTFKLGGKAASYAACENSEDIKRNRASAVFRGMSLAVEATFLPAMTDTKGYSFT
jgi:UDP-N-acetylenolpyruvoylglucosamine reductase